MQRNMNKNEMLPAMITNVGSDGITCMTQTGKLTISFDLSGFDQPPKVNEVWLIQRIASNKWKLWNRVTNGETNVMRYAIRLNAADCARSASSFTFAFIFRSCATYGRIT